MTQQWLKNTLLLLFFILLTIGSLNLFMDPYWCFDHSHRFNSIQKGTNERQQKANYIYFTAKRYDTILLGSSRTTYMNRHSFNEMNVFNFSASGMRPQEYITYIDFIINDTKQPIQTIILGIDFFGYLTHGLFMFDNAPAIVKTTKMPYYRWKMLFTFDALNNSFKNLRDYAKSKNHSDRYNRDNVKSMFKHKKTKNHEQKVLKDVIIYARTEYASQPNPDYKKILNNIQKKHHDKRFLIYTTPISEPLFRQMIKEGHYENYETWLRTIVHIYGTVYHFMYIHSVSKNYIEFFGDSNHAYPETNELIAHKITNTIDPKLPKDFGMILTQKNIDEKLYELRLINGIETK